MIAAPDRESMKSLVVAWLHLEGVSCTLLMKPSNQVHVHFASHDTLAAALKSSPLLKQCCCVAHSAWKELECGQPRHMLAERLDFSCRPQPGHKLEEVDGAVKELLTRLNIEYTTFWLPGTQRHKQSTLTYVSDLTFCVLPRAVAWSDLDSTIKRITLDRPLLWGGELKVHAPHLPSLRRCTQCSVLGHSSESCPVYEGEAVRLLFKSAVPFSFLTHALTVTGAPRGFLGHDQEQQPHRKVTLLFTKGMSTADMWTALQPLLSDPEVFSQLHGEPRPVNMLDRMNECRECGRMGHHQCEYGPSRFGIVRMHVHPQGGAGAARTQPMHMQPRDLMCKSWRRSKQCPRLDKKGGVSPSAPCGLRAPAHKAGVLSVP